MISFTVRMRFDPADHAEVTAHLQALQLGSRKEPGCVSYIAHFIEDDPNTVLIYEQYLDEAAVEFHGTTPHFAQHAIGGLYQKMRDRSREALIAIS
ncbi:antibiotic biosynthesis monooxygenase [Granulicella sp. WH15]|uniref:putative quinol monooxygenase n=1 Tax=Granulicella sp. WH15 TaxID=2602070 RepID=UPI0013677BB5|nr:putative quinol monooxygenase [Granulicella sp. WH15]QHN02467.1 antibiotic biosynthesis monooxygenase [Granulicella sp. WH15]